MKPAIRHPFRIIAFILIGPIFLITLGGLAYLRLKWTPAGIGGWINESLTIRPVQEFGIQYAMKILVPVYLIIGMAIWLATLIPGLLIRKGWFKEWTFGESLTLGLSAMLWAHLVLWWQVPTALWVIPGIRAIPFILLFPLLAISALVLPARWVWRQAAPVPRKAAVMGIWVLLWSAVAVLPQWLPRPLPTSRGGNQPCKVLVLGIDGLRSDTFLKHADHLKGVRYENAYTVIPATRLLWHILWGGDPIAYTIGHVAPSVEEFQKPHQLELLKQAMQAGWKPRFYIDDGGTIGIAWRKMDLDDALMPAQGWENFVNSNLSVNFPLYAVWENWLKPFPTTNPWASLDSGLRESLRLGRGSAWVMFHTCHAHQPIFLSRAELWQTGRWWSLSPNAYEPLCHIGTVTPKHLRDADPRTNPFRNYEIRMHSIIEAWAPIWNQLDQDPQYKDAVRIIMSDHGERFHNVQNGFQLQGVHGFNLDPWECKVTFLGAGPGFSNRVETTPRQATVSLLGISAGIANALHGGSFDSSFLESYTPVAPIRYHTLATSAFGQDSMEYRAEPEKDLAIDSYVGSQGLWFTHYSRSVEERSKDVSIGYAQGAKQVYLKPLKKGGATRFEYRGYQETSVTQISEDDFQKEKTYVENLLKDHANRLLNPKH